MNYFLHKSFRVCASILLLAVMLVSINSAPVYAINEKTSAAPTKTFTLSNPLKVDSVSGLVQNFVEIFSYVVIIIAVLLLVWVGLQFILARGDASKMKELKEWLFWIIIGVAVVIGARVIVEVVINTLASSGVDPNTINTVRGALTK